MNADMTPETLAPPPPPPSSPAAPSAALTVTHLVKAYGDRRAVDEVSFTVPAGLVYGLLGPNGAGKTTTLEMCAGLRRRDGGGIDLLGMDPHRLRERDRNRLGIVAQSGSERASLTVREMLAQYAAYCEDPWEVEELLAATGLAEKARARIATLSGGQRRRLDVALGIVARPELVFLDEPTTGFDPAARREFWELIRRLRRDGTTIVLTSHYLDEIEALADRVAVIRSGRIVAEGTLEQIRRTHGGAAVVSWTAPEGPQERTLRDPEPLLRELLTAHDRLPDLEVRRPSLEDIYLELATEETR
jgi:ABC-2 type transport system ATP-binding protein